METTTQDEPPCSCPSNVDDLAIMAAVDGEARLVCDCPACLARAAELAHLQRRLRAVLFRSLCPSSDTLADYRQGVLRGSQRASVAAHITTCPHCERELRMLAGVLATPLRTLLQ